MNILPPEEWPITVEQAAEKVIAVLTPEQRQIFRQSTEEDLIQFHDNCGRWIRNQFGLWGQNRQLINACDGQHPDDASAIILEAVWRRLRAAEER